MYINHEDLKRYWIIDIETDSLTPTRIWCAVVKNCFSKEVTRLVGEEAIREFIKLHHEDFWIGHNAISFDIPTLNRLFGCNIDLGHVVDTLVLSYLYDPRMLGGHSLEAWGDRFKAPKGSHQDWSQFSVAMLEYCVQDVEITFRLFTSICKRMRERGFSEESCKLEHDIRVVVDKQQRNGFYFNTPAAEILYADLRQQGRVIEDEIRKLFPATLVCTKSLRYRRKLNGELPEALRRNIETYPKHVIRGDEIDFYEYVEFNLGSPAQRADRLLSLGYKPTSFTPTGKPKVDEESLLAFAEESGQPQVKALAEWLVLTGRANMLNTWLNAVDYSTSLIHGRVFTCGAGTRRMTHTTPNTANVPSNEVKFGKEVRALWGARPGRVLVGADAKACQMRMFGHYLDNPVISERYINGDPHQVNTEAFGDPQRRKKAKNVFFAFIFGAQPPKLKSTWGEGKSGKEIQNGLYDANPGLRELMKLTQQEFERNNGWIKCIDGGFVRCPSPHAALNYKIQSAEKCAISLAAVLADKEFVRLGLDVLWVGNIHDEWQLDVRVGQEHQVGEICVEAIREAGRRLNFRVPLDGDYKVGPDWSCTH